MERCPVANWMWPRFAQRLAGTITIMSSTSTTHRSQIIYPDSDGLPMAENTLQFKWIVVIKEGLEAVFRNDANVFVAGDLFWYPQEGKPKVRTAPDALIVFGRPKGHRGSYRQWEEGGIPPQVVFEVLSPGNRFSEMLDKFHFYDRFGVDEFYLYDPDSGKLEGWLRGSTGLEAVPDMNGFTSPRLRIQFQPGEGGDNLAILGPDGQRFLTYLELVEQREAERQRAEAAEGRAERLAAQLRSLGIEPE